jgi:hypothetical protein
MTKRINLAFTRAGSFVMTGGVAIDASSQKELEEKLLNREFAEFLPLDIEYCTEDDDWEFEEIEEDEDQDTEN